MFWGFFFIIMTCRISGIDQIKWMLVYIGTYRFLVQYFLEYCTKKFDGVRVGGAPLLSKQRMKNII